MNARFASLRVEREGLQSCATGFDRQGDGFSSAMAFLGAGATRGFSI